MKNLLTDHAQSWCNTICAIFVPGTSFQSVLMFSVSRMSNTVGITVLSVAILVFEKLIWIQ